MKIWITGTERSMGAAIASALDSPFHSVISLNRPRWELTLGIPDIARLTRDEVKKSGFPDVVIHNAGLTKINWIEDFSTRDFEEVMRVNFESRWAINRELIYLYKKQCENLPMRFVHIESMGARYALRASSAYCASKAADTMLVRQLARETTGRIPGLTFMAVSPNSTEGTAMMEQCVSELMRTRGMTKEQAEAYNVQSPFGRLARMDEVVNLVKYVAIDAPEYCSGHNFEMPGASPA